VPNYLIRKQLFALGDDFWIEDEAGEKAFHVDGKVMRLRDTFVLETADGAELLKVQEKKLTPRKSYVIERQGEELATVSKAMLTPLRDKFKVQLARGGVLEAKGQPHRPRVHVEWENGTPMAEVSKRWFSVRDTYGVRRPRRPGRGARARDQHVHRRDPARLSRRPLPAAHEPRDRGHHLGRLGLVVGGADDAVRGVIVEQAERDLVERGLDRADLREDVDAVAVVLDHPLHAADLALDALEALQSWSLVAV
jgi:uncharacterized protein YxjI